MTGELTLPNGTISISDYNELKINDVVVTGVASTPSNWAQYTAISDVDMGGKILSNVGGIDLTNDGVKRTIKCSEIQIGNPANSFSINENTSGPYLQLNGNTYIDGSLTIPVGKDLTVDGSLYLGDNQISYSGGVLSVGGNQIGGNASTWATYPATATVNMGNYSISNASNVNASNITVNGTLTVRSVTEFPSNTLLFIPSFNTSENKGRIYRFLNGNNTGFINLDVSEYIYDIFYNNSLWVAVGNTSPLGHIYTSSNGTTWNKSASPILSTNGAIYSIIYASNIWVLVGGYTTNNQNIAYSTDGFNWSINTNATIDGGSLECIGYNGSNKWVIGGNPGDGWTLATLDNITSGTFTPVTGGFTNQATRVLYANNIWVAVGRDTNNAEIQYSINASNWYGASNITNPAQTFFTTPRGNALAYGNGYWLAGGGGQNIYGSLNGSNFSIFYTAASGTTVDDIKYESGSTFYATFLSNSYNILAKSTNNGSNWSIIGSVHENSVASRIGISYTPSYPVSSNTIIGGGTLNINSINLNGISMTTSPKSNILLYNSQPVNSIGGHIELRYSNGYVSYPLYITSTPTQISVNMSNGGWWNSYNSNTTIFSGVSVFPNYIFGSGLDSITNYYSNVSNIPGYLSLVNPTIPATRLYYTLTAI